MLQEPGSAEDPADRASAEPSSRRIPESRRRRAATAIVPLLAIGAVVAAILLIQQLRASGGGPGQDVSFAIPGGTDSLTPIRLGTSGAGEARLGKPAPGFQLTDPSGKVVKLSDFRGRPVVMNFWATWCAPCRREIPDLVGLQAKWGETAQVIGIDVQENAAAVAAFSAEFSINYPLVLDTNGQVTSTYRIYGLPETWFLDEQGIIRDHRIGLLKPEIAICIVAGIQAGAHSPENCR